MIVVHPLSGTTVAVQGIQQGMEAVQRAASEVARSQVAPTESVAAPRLDRTRALVDMSRYASQTRAAARTARVYNETLGTLLDVRA